MSDFFENENTEVEGQESTVFSAPAEHIESKIRVKKKLLPKIIAGILCVAVLVGGTFAVVKLIPKKQEETTSTDLDEIKVLNIDTKDVSVLSVKNQNGTYKIYGEEKEDDKLWYVDGINKDLIDTSKTSSLISSVVSITASREITEKSDDDCGFNKAQITAEITKTDNNVLTLTFGDESPDGNGCYLKLSGSDKIYLVDCSLKSNMQFDDLYFASSANIPAFAKFEGADGYFENDTLSKFDSLTVTGNNYSKPLIIVPNDAEDELSEYMAYKTTSPQVRFADNVDTLMQLFQNGIAVSGAYSYDTSNKALNSFGLDNPELTLSMKILSKELIYKFKMQSDGDYAAWCNEGNLIYKVGASTIESIVKGSATSYYSSMVCLYSINDLSSLTVGNYTFGIKALEEDENNDDKYEITYNGKKIDCTSFQNFYQYVVSLNCLDYTTDNAVKNDTVKLIFSFKDGRNVNIDFDKTSETKYQYSLNSEPMGKVSSSSVKKLLKYAEKVANGEKVSEIK